MARYLSKEDFGFIAVAVAVSNVAFLLSSSGLGPALIQRNQLEQGHLNATAFTNIVLAILLGGVLFMIAPAIANFYEVSIELTQVIRVLCLSLIFQSFGLVGNFLLQKELKFKSLFFIETGSYFISYSTGIILATQGFGLWSVVIVFVLTSFFNALGYLYATRQYKIRSWGFRIRHLKDLYSYGLGFTLGRLNDYIANSGISFMIAKLVSFSALGVFERSFRIMMLPGRYLGQVLQKVIFSGLAKVNDDNERLLRFYERGVSLMNVIMLPLSFLMILYAREIVLVLLGPKWVEAVIPLRILFFPLGLRVSVRMCDSLLRAKGYVYKNALVKFTNSISLVILIYIGHYWDLVGICTAISITSIIYYLQMTWTIKHRFNCDRGVFFRPFKEGARLTIFAAIVTVPSYYVGLQMFEMEMFLPSLMSLSILSISAVAMFYIRPQFYGNELVDLFDNLITYPKRRKGNFTSIS